MGLTLESTATTTAKTPDKQIAISQTGGQTEMYTVPSGRKFKGLITYQQTSDTAGAVIAYINDAYIYHMTKAGPVYIELAAGAVVKSASSTYRTNLVGVESDA